MKYDLSKNIKNVKLLVMFRRERLNVSSFQQSYIYIMYIQMQPVKTKPNITVGVLPVMVIQANKICKDFGGVFQTFEFGFMHGQCGNS